MRGGMIWMAILAVLTGSGQAGAATWREQSERDWPAHGLQELDIANPRGLVSVRASRDDRVHLVAMKIVRNCTERSATELSRQARVEADATGTRPRLSVAYPQRRDIRIGLWDLFHGFEIPELEVRLALEVPPSLPIHFHTASGDVE